jgi:glycerate 2-kinase
MVNIKNKAQLITNGQAPILQKARTIALQSLEIALKAVEPKKLMRSKLFLDGSCLKVDGYRFDLDGFKHIYVVGGGKASAAMAEALEKLLCERITEGIINVPYGTKQKTRIVKLNQAGHPIPDEAGEKGTRHMMELAKKAKTADLLICLVSGGGSSLMPLPRKGVSLKDKQELTDTLLKSGASIGEINVVRKHLSAFKGGWLAKKAYPATVLNLVLSDVTGDPLDSIASGPTVADSSTFVDAIKVLEKYCLWNNAASSIRKVLCDGDNGLLKETPKPGDLAFKKIYNVIIGNNRYACSAAAEFLRSEGLKTRLIDPPLEGEAKIAGEALAVRAKRVAASKKPNRKPAGLVLGGETTVKVFGKGKGGRNQELALSAALKLKNVEGCVIASLSTDGVDGPTDAAGAIIDGCALQRAKKLGLNAEVFLADNDSYSFFAKLGDLIKTGATGTNVNDITVIVIL